MPYSKIISANLKGGRRDTKNPWLIREFDQKPQKAGEAGTIYATGVAFRPSSVFEAGFGCTVVGYCVTATTEIPEVDTKELVQLHFNGLRFRTLRGKPVEACSQLILHADGTMFATPIKASTVKELEEAAAAAVLVPA